MTKQTTPTEARYQPAAMMSKGTAYAVRRYTLDGKARSERITGGMVSRTLDLQKQLEAGTAWKVGSLLAFCDKAHAFQAADAVCVELYADQRENARRGY